MRQFYSHSAFFGLPEALERQGWQRTRRALNLGQQLSMSKPAGRGRWHMRAYSCYYPWDARLAYEVTTHFDHIDPDRSWLHAVAHFVVDMIPWYLRGAAR